MMNTKHISIEDRIFKAGISLILFLICGVVLYPLMYVVSASLSNPLAVMRNDVTIWPIGFTLIGYEKVFHTADIWRGYGNTIAYTVVGTALNILLTAIGAFPLSRKDFCGRNFWTLVVTFTMFFSGGLIPSYLLINKLHMMNTFWVMIIPGAISTWNLIIMRTFFQSSVPYELQEAAIIDGCNDIQIFVKIILPLSTPVIAIMVLFYGVGHWNAFFNALIYLNDRTKFPLQLYLREILVQNLSTNEMNQGAAAEQEIIGESIRYALIVVATLPIVMVYPFLQKYFVKGVMIGAIKG